MKRSITVAGTIIVLLMLAGCMTADELSAFTAVNTDRTANSVAALTQQNDLVTKAQGWAQRMLDGSGGVCSLTTLSHSDLKAGAPAGWTKLGENVGCIYAFNDPSLAVASLQSGFMGSTGHRQNILDPAFNFGGIGIASKEIAPTKWVVFETQEFAAL